MIIGCEWKSVRYFTLGMHDALASHLLLPSGSSRRKPQADAIHLIRSLALHPGAVGIFIAAGLIGYHERVEAISGVRVRVVAIRVRKEVELTNIPARIAIVREVGRERRCVFRDGDTVPKDAQLRAVLASQEADTTRHAYGILDEITLEVSAFRG
jgi:hypothetical protein